MSKKTIEEKIMENRHLDEKPPFAILPNESDQELLHESFKIKAMENQYQHFGDSSDPSFQVQLNIRDKNGVSLLKESIDTYYPLNFYDNETGEVQYKEMTGTLSSKENLKELEGVFNLLKAKRESGEIVDLEMNLLDKDTGVSIFSDKLDQAEFMKTILYANQRRENFDKLKNIGSGIATLAAVYLMFDNNMVSSNTFETLRTYWDSSVVTASNYIVSNVDTFMQAHTSGESGNLLTSAFEVVIDVAKMLKETDPIALMGIMLGKSTYDSSKEIFDSYGEVKKSANSVDVMFGVEGAKESKNSDDYSPKFSI